MNRDQIRHIYMTGAGGVAMADEVKKPMGSRIHDGVVVVKYGQVLY